MFWLLLTLLSLGAEPNLLQNPGFETVTGAAPAVLPDHWNVFVMEAPLLQGNEAPQGRLDEQANEGQRSAFLSNPVAYRNEPCNNWSQTLWGNWAGKKLHVTGMVKTEDATAAAVWLQCWQRTPYKLLQVTSSSDRTPIAGTNGWTSVEMTVEVPEQTEFVMVRCVLRGKGKAWFDNLCVSEVVEAPAAPDPVPAPAASHPAPAPEQAQKKAGVEELESMVQSLKEFSKANEDLSAQVTGLQQEIQALRDQLKSLQELAATETAAAAAAIAAPAAPAVQKTAPNVPPLVPHEPDPDPEEAP